MKLLLMVVVLAGMAGLVGGCASNAAAVKTPADTQPRPYIDSVTNPQQQPGLDRTGSVYR